MNESDLTELQIAHSDTRRVEPEILDHLPTMDPRALRARRDLRRINGVMRNSSLIIRALRDLRLERLPKEVVEIGAGDGSLMLKVARQLAHQWPSVHVTLIDRHHLPNDQTKAAFKSLGWSVTFKQADVREWLDCTNPLDLVLANLFLHHFETSALKNLFSELASKTSSFVACEPRRFSFARLAGRLVAFVGASADTQHDAIASIAAGFRGNELSRLWPNSGAWRIVEYEAGLFSHIFCGQLISAKS